MNGEARHHRFLIDEVEKALRVLGEHFDACQFIGTFVDDNGQTHLISRGVGNWYARRGSIAEVLDRELAETAAEAIGDVMMLEEEDEGFE
jgi:hypothetical protein